MHPPDRSDSLARTLADWRVNPRVEPQFRPAVWQRLRDHSRATWSGYVRSHLATWSVVAAVAVAAAGWAGRSAGQARLSAERDAMIVSYLVELDPRVQARLRP